MLKKILILLIGTLPLFLVSCEEKAGIMDRPENFSIQPVSVPERINVSAARTYRISFKVTHPEGVDAIDSVWVAFFENNQSTVFKTIGLFDDGGFNNPGDGDVIARDGVFTNVFQSDSTIFPLGDIYIAATAADKDQNQLQTDFISSLSLLNKAPILVMISVPDTLPSGSDPVLFSAAVQDSNGIEDVPEMSLTLKQQTQVIYSAMLPFLSMSAADSGLYGAYFDSSFAAEKIGDYELEFQAVDLSGESSGILSKAIYIENQPPRLSNTELPDTVLRPGSGADTIVVRISANDHQGLSDIEIVTFIVQRDGGLPATLEMFDDGDFINHRDIAADDGIYSRGITVVDTSVAADYGFTFQAKDKVDNFLKH